jgi:membrane protein
MVEQTGPLVSKGQKVSTTASAATNMGDDQDSVAAPGSSARSGPAAVGLLERIEGLRQWLLRELWHDDPDEMVLHRATRALAQLVALTFRGFRTDQLMLRASALTYVTALSVIPMLGVVFAILRLVGGDETLIDFSIDQLTTVAPDVRATVRGYVSNLNFASFGTIGGALVFGTAIFALRHLERTLNDIWGVTKSRTWTRRFSDYLAVLVVAPISTGAAVSLATTLQSEPIVARLLDDPFFSRIYGLGLSQLPLVFLFVGFTFLYWFFPNTHVRLRAAALGGAVSAVLFSVARGIYVDFQVGAATYQTVFGALSAVPLILVWLYACWAVLLLGAEVAFAFQNLKFARREMRAGEVCPADREAVALELMVAVARAFRFGGGPPTAERLADLLDEPVRQVRRLLEELEQADLTRTVLPHEDGDVGFVPAVPLADLTVGQILRAIRGVRSEWDDKHADRDPAVSQTLEELEGAWAGIADQASLAALLESAPGSIASEAV